MAPARFLLIIFVIVAVSAPIISSTEFIVGDDNGWTVGFDYQAWAHGKEFHVGDKLVFNYPEGKHNVLRVNGTGFQQCVAPASTQAFTNGNDVIGFSSPGKKWYICGVGKHCVDGNMKLAITVQPQFGFGAPSPTPSPFSAATGSSPIFSAWIVLLFAFLVTIMG